MTEPGQAAVDGGLIDVHAHFLPTWYVDLARGHGHHVPDGMPAWPAWDLRTHLDLMDERRISRALLSLSSPGIALGPDVDLPALARRVNEDGAGPARTRPDRFGLLASLPLPDVDAALAELDHALDRLGADGVVLPTHAGGTYLTDPAHEPLWSALARRQCVVLLHPTSPVGSEHTGLGLPPPMMEFLFDTTRVVLGLALAGTLSRHPGLRLVIPHAGSLVPLLVDRAALFQLGMRMGLPPDDPEHDVPGVAEALAGLWWDLAGTPTATHVGALVERFGPQRLVYGSDFCFTPPIAVDLQLGLLDQVWAGLDALEPWRPLTRANAERLIRRPTPPRGGSGA
ncbi:amidohydrolase family protein [Actinacidiphila acididurans]|uniref:6-methylsalicylate decarboxylase n=1 Tax=Actinacidiphila acididurans TaxID=2784346 RepID=A0ABS2TM14_9ACTN|nr:amidohydrolase family protein [Actinacidiphila acididurans]MBM9504381.1 amidohydrolase [Actinacidiphila acididurans]